MNTARAADVVTVADCERAQTSWYDSCARAGGGEVWQDGPLHWAWLAHSQAMMLMFPTHLTTDAVRRGVREAKHRRANQVGAWLGLATDAAPLVAAGFELGWSPWWMAARIDDVGRDTGNRVRLLDDPASAGEIDLSGDEALFPLLRERPQASWFAVAKVGKRYAGHAWSHHTGELAGVFDMAVWPKFQRRGLGTELARGVCAKAADAGARYAVLNATPDGEKLYSTLGFERVGDGITYWLHLGREELRPGR